MFDKAIFIREDTARSVMERHLSTLGKGVKGTVYRAMLGYGVNFHMANGESWPLREKDL